MGRVVEVLVCSSCQNKISQTGWLKQKKFVSYNSGDWKVRDEGASWSDSCWELSSRPADGCFLARFSHGRESVSSQVSPITRALILLAQGSTLSTWFNWITSLLWIRPQGGIAASTHEFEVAMIQVIVVDRPSWILVEIEPSHLGAPWQSFPLVLKNETKMRYYWSNLRVEGCPLVVGAVIDWDKLLGLPCLCTCELWVAKTALTLSLSLQLQLLLRTRCTKSCREAKKSLTIPSLEKGQLVHSRGKRIY